MNGLIIQYILGQVLKLEGLLLMLPCLVSLIYHEHVGVYYLGTAIIAIFLGFIMTAKKPTDHVFYLKEGCIATALSWIILSIFGCIPFMLTGEIPRFTNALFETVSGFTTTGASILYDVEALSHASLFWRSFTHWIGGMGVLVFLLAIIPLSGGSNINLMRAESPGPSVGKLVPKIKYTARYLYVIYLFLTCLEIVLLLIGGMPVFDSITLSFGTAGTGGFGIRNDSLASYAPHLQWIITVFMILFGVNFNAYYLILFRQFKKAFGMEEVRYYFGIIAAAIAIIFFELSSTSSHYLDCLTKAAFQVGSIITTTGFSTADFDQWSQSSKTVLVLLMFIGACAGSTGGGIKVSRFTVLLKTVIKELNSYIHPKSVKKIKIDDKPVEHDVVRSINVYFISYMILFCLSVLLISFEGKDLITNFTSVAATFNNIGPGLELVGPAKNFDLFSDYSKYVLIFDMLAGRLELFPLLILFHPAVWHEALKKHTERKAKLQK